jgi:hypothetical protein
MNHAPETKMRKTPERVTSASITMMIRHAREAFLAQQYGWPVNTKDKLLRQCAEDLERLIEFWHENR